MNHPNQARRIIRLLAFIFVLIVLIGIAPSAITQAQSQTPNPTPGAAPSTMPGIEKILADTGFRPAVNGFSFPNYGNTAGVQNLTSADMQALFGDQVCANLQNNTCILTSPAHKKMDEVNQMMANGHCDGMAVLSILLYTQQVNPQDFGGSTPFSLKFSGNSQLQRAIARWYATQLLNPTYAAKLKFVSDKVTPTQVVDLLINSITTKGEQYALSIFKPDYRDGHTITPYAVALESSDVYRIMVYDNNFAGETRYIEVNPTTNTWTYRASVNPNISQSLYAGDATTGTLLLVPTSTRLKPQVCEFCTLTATASANTVYNQIMFSSASLVNKASMLITDQQGNQLGYVGDQLVSTIPGAFLVPITSSDLWDSNPEPEFYVPVGISFTITVDGSALTQEETASVAIIGTAYDLSVDDILLEPGAIETLTVSPDGRNLTFKPSTSEAPDITLGFDHSGVDYNFVVQSSAIDAGGAVGLALNPDKGQLSINTQGDNTAATYSFDVERIDDTSDQSFTRDGIDLAPDQRVFLDYAQWDGKGELPIEISTAGGSTVTEAPSAPHEAPTAAPVSNEPQNAALFSAVTYYQTAKRGVFSDNNDGTYTLKLLDVAPNTIYMASSYDPATPPRSVTQISTARFAATWKAGDDANSPIDADAALELKDTTVSLLLAEPSFDPTSNTLSYQAIINDVTPVGSLDQTKLPDTFDVANMLISETHTLSEVLITGLKAENVLTTGGQPNLTTGGQPNLTTGGQPNLTTGTTSVTGLLAWSSRLAKLDTSPDPSQLTDTGVYSDYQTAASGTLALNSNGLYTLNLTKVSPITLSQSATDTLGVIPLDSANWVKAWGTSSISVQAVLELPAVRLTLELSSPTGTPSGDSLTYTAKLISIMALDGSTPKPVVPQQFDRVDLLIANNSQLAAALTLGLNQQPLNLTTGGQPNLTTGNQPKPTAVDQPNLTTGTVDANTNLDCKTALNALSTALTSNADPGLLDDLNGQAIDVCPQSSALTIPSGRHLSGAQ